MDLETMNKEAVEIISGGIPLKRSSKITGSSQNVFQNGKCSLKTKFPSMPQKCLPGPM